MFGPEPLFRLAFVATLRNTRNAEMKARTLPNGAFHPDAAPGGLHDMPGDREAETGAACLARSSGVHPIKSLEDAFQVGFRNADTRVGNRKNNIMTARSRLHLYFSAGGRILQRVVYQILQYLAKLCAIPANGRHVLLQVDKNFESSGLRIEPRRFN